MLTIGPYKLASRVVLAPMAGVTDLPFRQLCRRFGAGLAVSEMITSDSRLWHTRKSQQRLNHTGESEPRSVQIAGSEPRMMAQAARLNVERGAQIIDINMGCPAKKVCKKAAGSALMKDPELVKQILQSVVEAVDVPVTLKIRTGWSPEHRNGVEIARIAEGSGIAALAVHGRTRSCRFGGNAEYDTIARIKSTVAIPVIANGDIDSPAKALAVIQQTEADAVMIGRAAQGQPWLCGEIDHYLMHGIVAEPPKAETIRRVMLEHLDALYDFYGEFMGVKIARKHVGWYLKSATEVCHNETAEALKQLRPQHCNTAFRSKFNQVDTAQHQRQAIDDYFQHLAGCNTSYSDIAIATNNEVFAA